ncbi:MAG: hypothetical protein ACOCRL_00375 [Bacillota bacterium]
MDIISRIFIIDKDVLMRYKSPAAYKFENGIGTVPVIIKVLKDNLFT